MPLAHGLQRDPCQNANASARRPRGSGKLNVSKENQVAGYIASGKFRTQ